jgi:chromosomal replication initiation ATPase DnaA
MAHRTGPRQLLALDHAESFAREDFLSGPSNEQALALIDSWPDWAVRAAVLAGPAGSGKSHLAAIWAEQAGARFLAARALAETALPTALATGALVVTLAEGAFEERVVPSDQPRASRRPIRC